MKNLKRVYAVFIRQVFLLRGNPIRLVNIFLWLSVDLLLWGFISRYLDTLGKATFSFATVLLGAVILNEFLTRVQQGVMTTFLEDVWSRNFLNFFASPLKIKEYVGGMVVSSIFTSAAGFSVMILIAGLGFGFNILRIGFYLLPFLIILFLFGATLGILAISIILRFGPSAEWIGWPIPFALSPFMGIFYPVSALPHALQAVARAIPASYVFEGMRKILMTGHFSNDLVTMLLVGSGLALIYLVLMYLIFFKVYRYVLKNGLIGRFGAE